MSHNTCFMLSSNLIKLGYFYTLLARQKVNFKMTPGFNIFWFFAIPVVYYYYYIIISCTPTNINNLWRKSAEMQKPKKLVKLSTSLKLNG